MPFYYLWLRITEEGSVPEMRIWSISLIQSDLKWCMHLSRSLFFNKCNTNWYTCLDIMPLQEGMLPILKHIYLNGAMYRSTIVKSTCISIDDTAGDLWRYIQTLDKSTIVLESNNVLTPRWFENSNINTNTWC